MPKIIGLVGEKLSGKDTTANYIAEKYSAGHFRFSHILDDILRILALDVSRRNEIDLGLGLRKIFGEHVLVDALHARSKSATNEIIVVNGIRMDEFEVVKGWEGAKIIYITAPLETRFERYKQRKEKADDAAQNLEQFAAQEKEPTEVGIPGLGARADYKIENTGTLEELHAKIDEIIKSL
jgi:dephospho-CoA kinase